MHEKGPARWRGPLMKCLLLHEMGRSNPWKNLKSQSEMWKLAPDENEIRATVLNEGSPTGSEPPPLGISFVR